MSDILMDQIRKKMESKSTDELLQIWGDNDREQWSESAFDIIRQLLVERGEQIPPQNTGTQPKPKDKRVGGWLLLFCLGLTIFMPLLTIFNFISGYNQISPYFDTFPGLWLITVIDTLLSIGLVVFSIYAGIALWEIRPNAVKLAKKYLLTLLGYSIFAPFLPFLVGLPSGANSAMAGAIAMDTFRSIIYVALWYSYLSKSKRVSETYGATVS